MPILLGYISPTGESDKSTSLLIIAETLIFSFLSSTLKHAGNIVINLD